MNLIITNLRNFSLFFIKKCHNNPPQFSNIFINQQGLLAMISLKKWCPEAESNCRHKDFQSYALPTELSGHYIPIIKSLFL